MNSFDKLLGCTKGNVATLFAVAAIPVMGFAGVAVDMARASHIRTVMQNAADAAAVKGAASKDKSNDYLDEMVLEVLTINGAIGALNEVGAIKQELDPARGTFTVKVAGSYRGSFLSLVGFKDISVDVTAVANVGSEALELALVLDNTGSMLGTKIENLKTAATTLVNIIDKEASDNADVRIAVVPFAEYVNVGLGNNGQGWLDMSLAHSSPWEGCVGSRSAPNNMHISMHSGPHPALSNVACNAPILPLTENLDAVKSSISTMTAEGWTYIPAGLYWGWNVLDSVAPFTEAKTKSQMTAVRGKKAIVLMTDGENTRSLAAPWQNGTDVADANTTLEQTCDAVKAAGIEVFTVSFMVLTPTVKNILQQCATTPTQYFDTDTGSELNSAFTKIAKELSAVRLTQ